MGQQNPAYPPGYNPAFPTAPASGLFPQVPNPAYPAGQYPAPMNPTMVPNAPPGTIPYGAPGIQTYPMAPGGVYPGPYPHSPKGGHHKGHHKGPNYGGFQPGAGMVVGGPGHKKNKKMKKMKKKGHKEHKHGHHKHGKVRFDSNWE